MIRQFVFMIVLFVLAVAGFGFAFAHTIQDNLASHTEQGNVNPLARIGQDFLGSGSPVIGGKCNYGDSWCGGGERAVEVVCECSDNGCYWGEPMFCQEDNSCEVEGYGGSCDGEF